MGALYAALVHGPVKNKNGDMVTTAVTGLNVHDISRALATYGAAGYFLVTPLTAQRQLVDRIVTHWGEGTGAAYNPNRKEALSLLEVVDDLADVKKRVTELEGRMPLVVATSARQVPETAPVGFAALSGEIRSRPDPILLVFGTGWGLSDEALREADFLLEPVRGPGAYNHLSVRSAVSIVLDRLLGEWTSDNP
ncbi:MAG: RNA methyltransferase [Leptospirillia bacterium]